MTKMWIAALLLIYGMASFVCALAQTDVNVASAGSNQANVAQFNAWLSGSQAAQRQTHPVNVTKQVKPAPVLTLKQSQQAIMQAAPKSGLPANPVAQQAFNQMAAKNMPLTPKQIVRLHQLISDSQRAAAMPVNIPPKPVSSTLMVNLAPGATPPVIRLSSGLISSLVFVGATGAEWPIESIDVGDPKTFVVQWDKKSNVMMIQPVRPYHYGNIAVRLVGLPTPIMLTLVPAQRVIDYRVDVHIPRVGPKAVEQPVAAALPGSASQLLLNVLDGIAPSGSHSLTVEGGGAEAWLLHGKIYLRTRMTLLSPGYISTMTSPDGMHAYELPKAPSILVSKYGQPVEMKLEGI